MKKIITPLLLLALLLAACSTAPSASAIEPTLAAESAPLTVSAEGKLLPAQALELSFAQGGIIAEVFVRPGDKLVGGDVLASLSGSETVQAELAAAHLEQTLAEEALTTLQRNALLSASEAEKKLLDAQKAYENEANSWNLSDKDNASDLELSLDDYITIEEDYRQARDELDELLGKEENDRRRLDAEDDFESEKMDLHQAYSDLLNSVSENNKTLNEKQADLMAAIASLEIARDLQNRLDENNLDPDQQDAAKARLVTAQAHIKGAEAALANFEIRVPLESGNFPNTWTLLSLDPLKPGEFAVPGSPVAYLTGNAQWTVETKDLAEMDITRVKLGQSALVKLDAFPGEEFTGQVSSIDPLGREYLGDMTYQVTIILDETDNRFFWGMTATVTITVE